jgi:iron complex outermembrane receptor protein
MSLLPHATPRALLLPAVFASAFAFAAPVARGASTTDDANSATPAAVAAGDDEPFDPAVLDMVVVRGLQPSSLPLRIPTTVEGITGDEIRAQVNATDAEDALKYLPSLLVRKRYIGDYDHAVLATRASGTGNSARSLVYADGILLSNLLGNGYAFTPRWGLVNPEEIERVDVLYGPFSAAYPGNSVGAVVDYVTRMPRRFEAHARLGYSVERFSLYGTHDSYPATTQSASFGNQWGLLSAWLSVSRLDSQGHPIAFANLARANGADGTGTPVSGAIPGRNSRGQPWYLVGATNQTHTTQDLAKLKLAWEIADDLRLSYLLGTWRNDVFRDARSYLVDAAGAPVYDGDVLIDGRRYVLAPTAIALQRAENEHRIQGLSLKRRSGGDWDYSVTASRYDYVADRIRSPLSALPAARSGGPGLVADSAGTGWRTFSAMATWRPVAAHALEFGVQDDRYRLHTLVSETGNWINGAPAARRSAFSGTTGLRSVFVQDTWTPSADWTAVLGARSERWTARDGRIADATSLFALPGRSLRSISPKAALQYAPDGDWSLKASIGRAVRFPTVSELYQGSIASDAVVNNDPDLKPERSLTSELSYVREVARGRLRVTLFQERTRDALYAQTNVTVTPSVTNVQNVDAIRTRGLELAADLDGIGSPDFDLAASLTFADSIITANRNFPASVGHWQPRVPRWRANVVGTWHPGPHWSVTGALRYSGRQFNTLDNSDIHSGTYMGTSPFLVADMRVVYRMDAHWSGALGVDNLGNRTYWNFHPYNQRTWNAELRYDYP